MNVRNMKSDEKYKNIDTLIAEKHTFVIIDKYLKERLRENEKQIQYRDQLIRDLKDKK